MRRRLILDSTNLKDIAVIVMVIGLLILLGIITIGDFYVALAEHRPVDESVINLLQMSITGMVGIIAGYINGKPKCNKEKGNE
jgi:hypothetical protein